MQNSCFKRMSNPGAVPQNIAVSISFLAILLIFVMDVYSGSEIALQILYVFPLVLISFHCGRVSLVVAAVVLSVVLQGITFFTYISVVSKTIDILMVLWPDVLIVFVSHYARNLILEKARRTSADQAG